MRQPTPFVDENDVAHIVKRDFPEEEHDAVFAVLAKYEYGETHRVQMGALKNSDGNIEILKQQIESANCDYRYILAAAEYPASTKNWSGIQKLTEREQDKIIQDDCKQYQEWLNK